MGCLTLRRGAAPVTGADAAWALAALLESDDATTGAMLLDAARAVIADRLQGGNRSTAAFLERLEHAEGLDGRPLVAAVSRMVHVQPQRPAGAATAVSDLEAALRVEGLAGLHEALYAVADGRRGEPVNLCHMALRRLQSGSGGCRTGCPCWPGRWRR